MKNPNTKTIEFSGYTCRIMWGKYGNGRLALQLLDDEDWSPVAVASVNLPDVYMAPDEMAVKDWSENEGMLDALMEAGIVEKPHAMVPTGFVMAPICKIKPEHVPKQEEVEV